MKLQIQDLVLTALFASLTAIGASIHVPLPFTAIPITLQTLFVYIAGVLLGSRLGALSQSLYVLMGIVGLPVFAGWRSGFEVLIGPTGGYILGFIPGSYVIGKLADLKTRPSFHWLLLCMTAGTLVIYLLGILQITFVLRIGFREAMVVGVFPFIVGDLVKTIIAAFIVNHIRSMLPLRWSKG